MFKGLNVECDTRRRCDDRIVTSPGDATRHDFARSPVVLEATRDLHLFMHGENVALIDIRSRSLPAPSNDPSNMPRKGANDPRKGKGASEPPKSTPPLRSDFKYQDRPRRHWIIVQEFGQNGGGCNGGVAKVEIKDDPVDRFFFEKRFDANVMFLVHKEVGLLNQLGDWPGVVKMVDHFIDEKNKKASVYMEYCDAGDLEKVIQDSRKGTRQVHERKIWQWLIELMDTLVYMHRGPEPENDRKVLMYWNSVYHRDIKPGNILLKTDHKAGRVVTKMADFGCSVSAHWTHMVKRDKPEQVSMTSALTPGYDPPEHPEYSGATDVWQVALVIACTCSSIIAPWSKQWPKGQRWDKAAPAGRKYSQKLNKILAWCLTEDQTRRPKPLEISKRAKADYASINLPPDNDPMVIFGREVGQAVQTPQPAFSPGPAFGGQQPNFQGQRPGLDPHAFSDPEIQRMENRGGQYNDFVQDHRSPMPMASMNGILHGGGAYPAYPFEPWYGLSGNAPGRPHDYFSGRRHFRDPRDYRRGC
ncbi:hypothetical protein HBH75_023350 [Parastagonospora nodorum]|nr:hypothetical protein HBH75_023350 [Parastagonospora nodorum]KAH4992459.1 hypothetical protein HBI76_050510 [Parastagonospora nodorum]